MINLNISIFQKNIILLLVTNHNQIYINILKNIMSLILKKLDSILKVIHINTLKGYNIVFQKKYKLIYINIIE